MIRGWSIANNQKAAPLFARTCREPWTLLRFSGALVLLYRGITEPLEFKVLDARLEESAEMRTPPRLQPLRDISLQLHRIGGKVTDAFGGFFRRHRIFVEPPAELLL